MIATYIHRFPKKSASACLILITLSVTFFIPGEVSVASLPVPYLVKDIYPGDWSSTLHEMQEVNRTLFFSAQDDVHGQELWKSDGTQEGTVLVKDIYSGKESSDPRLLTSFNNFLYFAANDGAGKFQLWKSDGTELGTRIVHEVEIYCDGYTCPEMAILDGWLYFTGNDGVHGFEIWKTNGTASGTLIVKDIHLGIGDSLAGRFTPVGRFLFFVADDGLIGTELWKTDGSVAGTTLVSDVLPGENGSFDLYEREFFVLDERLFFRSHRQLYVSDGTPAGTFLLKRINEFGNSDPNIIGALNGKVFFFAEKDTNIGTDLWKTDGTSAGTVMVKEMPKRPSIEIEGGAVLGDKLFFGGNNECGEIWSTDGTTDGTVKVGAVINRCLSYVIPWVKNINGILYFGVYQVGGFNNMLWTRDGSKLNTVQIHGINPDFFPFRPYEFIYSDWRVFLNAQISIDNGELWALDVGDAGPVALNDLVHTFTGQKVSIPVLDNDYSKNSASLFMYKVSKPAHGSVTLSGSEVVYTPEEDYSGIDHFTYWMQEDRGPTDSANVKVIVYRERLFLPAIEK
jgi:ELWxxDGT repeat protein